MKFTLWFLLILVLDIELMMKMLRSAKKGSAGGNQG